MRWRAIALYHPWASRKKPSAHKYLECCFEARGARWAAEIAIARTYCTHYPSAHLIVMYEAVPDPRKLKLKVLFYLSILLYFYLAKSQVIRL